MRRTAELGLMLALALILSYVESLIPFSFGIPGVKLGLPNLIVLLLLYDALQIQTVPQKWKSAESDEPDAGAPPRIRFANRLSRGEREALLINGLRIVLSGFLFSSLYAILYALAGAVFSFAAMYAGRRMRCFSMLGVSVLGGVFHNIGQLLTAMAVVETFAVFYYAPFLLVAGTVTGALLGLAGRELLPYLHRIGREGE